MRPRVFPAEDVVHVDGAGAGPLASMRPRVFPAEDCEVRRAVNAGAGASMRPRVFPAEDGDDVVFDMRGINLLQ